MKYVSWYAKPVEGAKERFGPPIYDAKNRGRKWCQFKRGFVWGGSLTTILTAQFVTLQHIMQPGKRPILELAALPFIYGFLVGCVFGGYEVISNP